MADEDSRGPGNGPERKHLPLREYLASMREAEDAWDMLAWDPTPEDMEQDGASPAEVAAAMRQQGARTPQEQERHSAQVGALLEARRQAQRDAASSAGPAPTVLSEWAARRGAAGQPAAAARPRPDGNDGAAEDVTVMSQWAALSRRSGTRAGPAGRGPDTATTARPDRAEPAPRERDRDERRPAQTDRPRGPRL